MVDCGSSPAGPRLLPLLLDHASQLIAVLSPDGAVMDVNRATHDVTGLTRAEALGRPLWECRWFGASPEVGRRTQAAVARATQGESVRLEMEGPPGERGGLAFDLSVTPVRDAAGRVSLLVSEARDITHHKALERQHEENVGLVSHDLRNPLSLVMLRTELLQQALQQRGLEEEAHRARAILHDARHMDSLIEDLLESARLEARGVVLHRSPTDLRRLVAHVLEEELPPAHRGRFRLDLGAPVPMLSVDRQRVERVLVNLCSNALKYAPEGTPIEVTLGLADGAPVVSVCDHGPGIAAETAGRLFDKFYRAPEIARAPGHGLGLYISRLIVEAHGGRIWVETAPGQGCRFTFTLPAPG